MTPYRSILEKNDEKDNLVFQNFPKEIHRIANLGSGAYRGPPVYYV